MSNFSITTTAIDATRAFDRTTSPHDPHHDPQPSRTKVRWQPYLLLWIFINSCTWGGALLFLYKSKPTFVSKWALLLPGTAPGVNVNLPDIGQASSSSSSAFGGTSSDPRANYQFIATSDAVIAEAAAALKMDPEAFGEPRIKLVDNSTIMKFEVSGSTPEEAQRKSKALYAALSKRLQGLRIEEISKRDEGVKTTLASAQEKLRAAQERLSDYKAASGLSFQGQVDNLSVNVEQLRRQRVEVQAQRQQTGMKLAQLSANLGITPQQAATAFALQSDQVFQQNMKDYSEAKAMLTVMLSKWGESHPTVVKEQARQEASQAALLARAKQILGKTVDQRTIEFLQLSASEPGAGRAGLMRDLIATQAEYQGYAAQGETIAQQVNQFDGRLSQLSQRQSTLENLKREMQTAEAVFASTLAKIDLSKSDLYTAYPLAQLIAEPNLPKTTGSPQKSVVILGALGGTCLTGIGFLALAWRKRLIEDAARRAQQEQDLIPRLEPQFESAG